MGSDECAGRIALNDRAAFVKLVSALSPWRHQLVFVGGWAQRLFRLHPRARALEYEPWRPSTRTWHSADRSNWKAVPPLAPAQT